MKRVLVLLLALFTHSAFADCTFREATAGQTFLIGPFVDQTDGITAEVALTIANTDIRISKAGGNIAAKNAGGGTHDEHGLYQITLDATDTDTPGTLQISVQDVANHAPVWHECMVYSAGLYDLLDGSSLPMTSRQAGNPLRTTLGTPTTQLELPLTAGATNNDAYNDMCAVFQAGTEECSARIDDYTGTGFVMFLDATANTCGGVTLAATDNVLIRDGSCGPAVQKAQLDLDVITGAAGVILESNSITATALDQTAVDEIWDNFYQVRGTADSGSATSFVDDLLAETDADHWAKNLAVIFTSGSVQGQVFCVSSFVPASDTINFAPAATQAVTTNGYVLMPAPGCDPFR